MPFIPNAADAFHESQASPDSGHFETLRAGSKATGVVSGGAVTAQGTPDMTVAVASAVIAWEGTRANVTAGNLTLTADGTDPRFYLIVASSAGVKSAVAGTPAPEMEPGVPGPVFPAIPASSVVLASVYVPAADTDIDANQIDDMRVFVVPPEPTTNYDLSKARSIPLVKERSETVTLASGENQIHGFIKVGSRLFGSTMTSPAKLIRFNNLEDLTDRTTLTFASDGFHGKGPALVYVAETDRIYVVFMHASRTTVAEVNPDTMTSPTDVISNTSTAMGNTNGGSICSDGTNLYILNETSPSVVLKYQISDFTLQGTATLTGRTSGHAMLYDGVNVYATGNQSPAWIARVNPADMTFTDASFPTGVTTLTDDIASVGDYIWVAREAAAQQLIRVNKADLTTEVVRVPSTPSASAFALHYDGQWIWAGLNSVPGTLVRVDPHTGQGAFHTFATGEDSPNEIVSDGSRLFVTFFLSPAKVKRLVPPAMPSPGLPVTALTVEHVADSNTGTSEQTLLTYANPGSTLGNDGDAIRVTASGWFAANANAKRILLKFGLASPVAVFDTGSLLFNDADWWLEALCVRTGANAQKWVTKWTSSSSLLATKVQRTTTTQTDTGQLNVHVRGVGVADADVTNEVLVVEVLN